MKNKLILPILLLAFASCALGQIQVVKTAFNQDKDKNSAFNALLAVSATAGQKLIVTINQEASHDTNIMSVKYGGRDFTLAVRDDGSNFKMSEIWYLDVQQDQVADVVVRYCDTSRSRPVPVIARSAIALVTLTGAALGGPVNTYTLSRIEPVIPTAVNVKFSAGKISAFVVGAYVQNNGKGQPQNPTQFSSILTGDCGSSNAAVGYSLASQSGPISYQWTAPAGFEIHADNAVALASFAPRATN